MFCVYAQEVMVQGNTERKENNMAEMINKSCDYSWQFIFCWSGI